MPRKLLIRTDEIIYHITSRANNKEWFSLPLEDVWKICVDKLEATYSQVPFELNAFVLMHNHYHMLVRTPMCNIDEVMFEFNRTLSQNLRKQTGRINRMFGGRYHWSLIENERYLFNVFKYVFQNPLRKKLARRCEDYPHSTLHYQVNKKTFPVPLHTPIHVNFCDDDFLKWANLKFSEVQRDCLRRGLKHAHFEINGIGPKRISDFDAPVIW